MFIICMNLTVNTDCRLEVRSISLSLFKRVNSVKTIISGFKYMINHVVILRLRVSQELCYKSIRIHFM